ncbi:acetyl-CoA C-acetyltransferase [Euzebya tangerina]|uniref:acetyl-CoA C-acetyltransferase n=1 Tax=Euzebya tangerina TaxID=591198 RepID=UPI000E30C228|nr:acetyl-CoA C-acetyltransferase [Euzebya tangerina]
MQDVVIVGYARTPIGKFLGGYASLTAMDLGGRAIAGALDRAGVDPGQVDQVYMGHVLQAGQGQITARQAATIGGIGMEVPAVTINKVCPSGMAAIGLARQTLLLGEADVIVAGGMESMTGAPYVLPAARQGARMGNTTAVDAMIHDGLWCAFENSHMGEGSDAKNDEYGISREAQDEWAAMSHERAVEAWKDGRFDGEVVPVEVPQRKGDPVLVEQDEGMRPGTTAESLARLRPAFTKEGTITAGNASQVSDGGAAVVMTTALRAAELGVQPLGRILSYGTVAGPDPSLHHQPAEAIRAAAAKVDVEPGGLDLYEMNEAFASVAIHSAELLGVEKERVNVNGGAVAIGHPIGCTGARITVTLLHELRNRGGGRGAASLCGGGGQGDALILETM